MNLNKNVQKMDYSKNLQIFKQKVLETFGDESLLEDIMSNNAKKLYGF